MQADALAIIFAQFREEVPTQFREEVPTKEDLAVLKSEFRADLALLEADLTWRFISHLQHAGGDRFGA